MRAGRLSPDPYRLVYRNLAQEPEIAQHAARPQYYRSQGIVRDGHGQAGLFADALVEVLEQGAAAGEHDAAVADVGAQFGRRSLQRHTDGVDDRRHTLRERFADLTIVDGDGARHAFDQVASLD